MPVLDERAELMYHREQSATKPTVEAEGSVGERMALRRPSSVAAREKEEEEDELPNVAE